MASTMLRSSPLTQPCSARAHARTPSACPRPTPHPRTARSGSSSHVTGSAAEAASAAPARDSPLRKPDLSAPPISPRAEAQLSREQQQEIYDRLIKIFKERPREDWKKLIVFSKQWPEHKNGIFDRVKEIGDKTSSVDDKLAMRRMFRALQNVDAEVTRYNELLKDFLDAVEADWDAIVAAHRGDMQTGFFQHVQCLIAAAGEAKDLVKREQLVLVNTKLLGLCSRHDSVAADEHALQKAAEVYRDLLSTLTSVEDIDTKMAELSQAGKIDPAFLQISAKAYGHARDTNMTLDEAKWVAYKLFRHARDHFERQQPGEKRIIEYLLSINDPAERSRQLDAAVTPGPSKYTDTHDYLYSTPERLHTVVDGALQAYDVMADAAKKRMNAAPGAVLPVKIQRLRQIRDELLKRYL